MTTVDQVVTQLLRSPLLAGRREPLDILNGNITASDTSVVNTDGNDLIRGGTYIEIDSELMYVRSVSTNTMTVLRAQLGTTAAAHTSGAIIRIEPRFSRQQIMDALRAEIEDLPYDVYAVEDVELTWPAHTTAITLPAPDTTAIRLLRVVRVEDADSTRTPRIVPVRMLRRMDTDEFSSGYGLVLKEGMVFSTNQTVRVTYGRKFDTSTWTTATDLNSDVGLSAALVDAIKAGALWRLMQGTEIERTQVTAVGPSRDQEAVPPTHRMQVEQGLLRSRDLLISREIKRLHDEFGIVAVY